MMQSFVPLPNRDAWATIRGYVYQVDLTIMRWLDLRPGQALEIECGEDIDTISQVLTATGEMQQRLLEQVKHRESISLTLRSLEAISAIANFFEHRTANPDILLCFRFTTNAKIGREKHSPIPHHMPGIRAWEQLRKGLIEEPHLRNVLEGIRTLLLTEKSSSDIHEKTWQAFHVFIQDASHAQFLDFISAFEWSTAVQDVHALRNDLLQRLMNEQYAKDQNQAQAQYQRLFFHVFQFLSQHGIKRITVEERNNQLSLPELRQEDRALFDTLMSTISTLDLRMSKLERGYEQQDEKIDYLHAQIQQVKEGRGFTVNQDQLASVLKRMLEQPNMFAEPSLLGPPFDEALLSPPEHFIGRTDDQEWLLERIRTTGLAVLRGMRGIGKTALAAVTIRQLREEGHFNDGIAVVSCQDLTDALEVLRRILARFDSQQRPLAATTYAALLERTYALLKGRNALIVLDSVEPGLPIEKVIHALRQAGVSVLLTASHILPHTVIPVEACRTLPLLSSSEALDLFAISLSRKGKDDIATSELHAVERIIAALDRHTFAVKLAGAYAMDLHRDFDVLASELEDPQRALELPDGERSDAVALILTKSTQALPTDAKRLFTALAAFHSTELSRNAAVALARVFGIEKPEASVDLVVRRALLDALTNTSMPVESDRERLHIHLLLHGLAVSEFVQWTEEQRDTTYAAIAWYYVFYMQKIIAAKTSDQALLFDEENIIVPIEWAYARLQGQLLVFLCLVMGRFWRDHGHTEYSLHYIPQAIVAAEGVATATHEEADRLSLGHLKLLYGQVLQPIGRLDEALSFVQESLVLFQEMKDQHGEIGSLLTLGHIARSRGQVGIAEHFFQQALALERIVENSGEEGNTRGALGQVLLARKQLDEAEHVLQESLLLAEKAHYRHGEAVALTTLGQVVQRKRKHEEAEAYFKKALAICREIHDRQGEGTNLGNLGQIAYEQGKPEEAKRLIQEALAIHREIHDRQGEGIDIGYLGKLAFDRKYDVEAKRHFQEALAIHREVQDRLSEMNILLQLGMVTGRLRQWTHAEQYYRQGLVLANEVEGPETEASLALMLGVLLVSVHRNRKEGCPLLVRAITIRHDLGLPGEEQARMIASQMKCIVKSDRST